MVMQKIGQYRVIERLGTGGMGRVYRATDETLGRDAALKVLDLTGDGSAARLRAEAAAMARLSHPGIATVFELIEDDSRLVLAMELVRGQTLGHILDQVGVFSPRRAAELCMQALAALQHAHAAGVVHRDLKPGNLMLTDSGSLKITDFGIARLEGSLNLTSIGEMLGTPAYMAPEQVLGHPVDARTDLYAMGVVMFRLVTAGLPFKGDTPFDMAQSQVNDLPMRASELRPDLPVWVDEILERALAKKPAERFQSAVEFHEALARALSLTPAPMPVVAAAVEITEVMARPEFAEPAVTPARVEVLPAVIDAPEVIEARVVTRTSGNGWLTAAAIVVLASAAWMFTPSGASSADSTTSTAAPSSDAAAGVLLPEPPGTDSTTAQTQPRADAAQAPAVAKAATGSSADARTAATPTPAPPAPSVSPARPAAAFKDVKFLAVTGTRTSASDVVVQFSDGEISVQPADGKTAASVWSYREVAKATYSRGGDPKWDSSLGGPAKKIDVPGIFGRARHWLVLQGTERYIILRLDGEDRETVLKTFEERSGKSVYRVK